MKAFISWYMMLDWGRTIDGPVSVVRLVEHDYYLAYELTPHAGGVGHSVIGEWQAGEIILG